MYLDTTTDIVQDQVIRYNPNTAVYNRAYINKQILFDILSAVLKQFSVNSIFCILIYINFIQDPCIPIYISDNILAILLSDPDITVLKQKQEKLKTGVYQIQKTDIKTEIRYFIIAISSTKSRYYNIVSEKYRADYFCYCSIKDIEKQNNRYKKEKYIKLVVQYQIPEKI